MSNVAELAVRRYLNFLADPKSIVDSTLVSRLEGEIGSASDPIEKLKAVAALEKANSVSGDSVRADFIAHAKEYGHANEISASAFHSLGVPQAVLRAAGLEPNRKGPKAKSVPAGRQRAPKVAKSAIRAHILSLRDSFTLNDLMDNIGGSIGTVNSVVKELVTEQAIRSLGPDKSHNGRGRAPIRYSR